MLQDEDEVVEHGLLVEAGGAAEVAQEAAAGHDHFVRGRILQQRKRKLMGCCKSVGGSWIKDVKWFVIQHTI